MALNINVQKNTLLLYSTMTAAELIPYIQDLLEGGYFHPAMYQKDPGFFAGRGDKYDSERDRWYSQSGETMFGLDRKAGAPAVTVGVPQEKFWALVDAYYGSHHADLSYWNDTANGSKSDIPASVGQQLRQLGSEIALSLLSSYTAKYLTEPAKSIIYSNAPLLLQFLYASYNGPVFFRVIANLVKDAVASGTTDATTLYNMVSARRRQYSNYFAKGADKLDRIAAQLQSSRGGGFGWLLWLSLGIFAVTFLTSKNKKK